MAIHPRKLFDEWNKVQEKQGALSVNWALGGLVGSPIGDDFFGKTSRRIHLPRIEISNLDDGISFYNRYDMEKTMWLLTHNATYLPIIANQCYIECLSKHFNLDNGIDNYYSVKEFRQIAYEKQEIELS